MNRKHKIKLPKQEQEIVDLLVRFLKLETIDKLTVATTFLIVALVLFALGTCALFFLSAGLVHTLSSVVGDEAIANYIVGGSLFAIMICVYLFRVPLVENRVVASLSRSFFKVEELDEEDEDDEEDDESEFEYEDDADDEVLAKKEKDRLRDGSVADSRLENREGGSV